VLHFSTGVYSSSNNNPNVRENLYAIQDPHEELRAAESAENLQIF